MAEWTSPELLTDAGKRPQRKTDTTVFWRHMWRKETERDNCLALRPEHRDQIAEIMRQEIGLKRDHVMLNKIANRRGDLVNSHRWHWHLLLYAAATHELAAVNDEGGTGREA
jgi:hypothetical protein